MRRSIESVLLALLALTTSAVAQGNRPNQPPRPPQPPPGGGGVQPLAGGGGGGSGFPGINLIQPQPLFTTSQYPYIEIVWCDNEEGLDGATRQITVNGINRTTSFTYDPYFGGGCTVERRRSTTTSVPLNLGINTIAAYICDYGEPTVHCTNVQWYVERQLPDVAALEDYGRCAMSCFAATYAQGTVPYFSLDAPRSVTLAYNGDRVDPRPFVHVDFTVSGSVPSWLQLRARKADGTYITFLSGESALRYTAALGTWRLGGQFDAAANGMGSTSAYLVDLVVGQMFGGLQETVVATRRVIVVRADSSAVARGWTLAGIQRLYVVSGGGALITEGDGSAVYYTWNGSQYTAPAGEFSRLSIVGSNYQRAYPDSTKVMFASTGLMTSVTDRFGNATTIGYTSGKVTSIADPNGNVQTLNYGTYGLSSIVAAGRTTTVSVPGSNRLLTAITDPDGIATQFGYDASQRLGTVTDRGGATSYFSYHSSGSGKLDGVVSPWTDLGSGILEQPWVGLTAWHHAGVPYGPTSGTPFAPPVSANVTASVRDPENHVTSFTVNGFGQPLVTTYPIGSDTVVYTAHGLPTRISRHNGAVDSILYNTNNLPTYIRPAGLPATRLAYTAGRWALPDSTWGAGQPRTWYRIGANGRIDSVRVATNAPSSFTYDSRGRVERAVDPQGHLVQRTWYLGTNGNRSRDSVPEARQATYLYDSYGRDTSVSQTGLPTRSQSYDILNRVTARRDGVNGTPTRFFYSALRLDSVMDPANQTYRFLTNALGAVLRRTDPGGRIDIMLYNKDGQLVRWWNRRSQATDYTYDALHRPLSKSGANTPTESWTYSPNGLVVVGTSLVSRDSVFLSLAGQPVTARTDFLAPVQTFWRQYHYNSAGQLDTVTLSGGGVTFTPRYYSYSPTTSALTDIRLGAAITALGYNGEDYLSSVTLPGGAQITRGYSTVHGLSDIGTSAAIGPWVTRDAGYDIVGRLQRQIEPGQAVGREFSYDGLSRLVADSLLLLSGGNPCSGWPPPDLDANGNPCVYSTSWYHPGYGHNTYAYDAVGNRLDNGGSYNPGNRITNFANCTYTTDFDGNVTSRSGSGCTAATFTWTAENRLASVTTGGQTYAFHYDAFGRLVRRDLGGALDRHFLWNGDNLAAELNGTATSKLGEYSYYPGLDNLHAFISGTTAYYAHADALGNTIGSRPASRRKASRVILAVSLLR